MIKLKAYAKVNLSLYITGVRADGYHLLDTVMQSISLCDLLSVKKSDSITVKCSNSTISGSENICYKAAEMFFYETKIQGGADIYIEKRIPLAAGLGGGSADAAAVLKGLNSLYGLPLKEKSLLDIGLRLGADVPFCIKGGCALVRGIGEELTPIKNNLDCYILLIKEGVKASTAYMYKELDKKLVLNDNGYSALLCDAIENGDYNTFLKELHNDFSVVSDINKVCEKLRSASADSVSLSGSGPTVMGFFKEKEKAERAFNSLKAEFKEIYLASFVTE